MGFTELLLTVDNRTNDLPFNLNKIPISDDLKTFIEEYKYVSDIITLALSVSSIFLGVLLYRIVLRALTFHIHLRTLVLIAFICYFFFRLTTDASLILTQFYKDDPMCMTFVIPQRFILIKFGQTLSGATFILFLGAFMTERMLATVWMKSYETYQSYLLMIFLTVTTFLIAFGISMVVYLGN
uniref:G_PROTEIN_RECEP_F1_2 domain-containing protein n=1 Tax=Panagrellus redivivus TaxID=6233 RepID=A0A7E4W0H3_PANRE